VGIHDVERACQEREGAVVDDDDNRDITLPSLWERGRG
jgi:hypothetical protein